MQVMSEINHGWRTREVTADVEETASPQQLGFIPPLLWSQLYHSLQPFLELRMGSGGYLVFCWSHRHLKEAAEEHYLKPEATASKRYTKLAEYFCGDLTHEGTSNKCCTPPEEG